jgi:soluble P-type ATPase
MIAIDIPGFRALRLDHLVVDYNGTLAEDGRLLAGVAEALEALAGSLAIHVVTADTFGVAAQQLAALPVELVVVGRDDQAEAKVRYATSLGASTVVAIGNGRNDREMLGAAALGIAVIQHEGASSESIAAADVVATSITQALALLRYPKRLVATLRS